MKKLFFGGMLFLAGWIGIITINCAKALDGQWDKFKDFLQWNGLTFLFFSSLIICFSGLWMCFREVYLRKMLDDLEKELVEKQQSNH